MPSPTPSAPGAPPRNLRHRLKALDRLIADAKTRLGHEQARLDNWTAIEGMTPPTHVDAHLLAVTAVAKSKARLAREAHRLRMLQRARAATRRHKPKAPKPAPAPSTHQLVAYLGIPGAGVGPFDVPLTLPDEWVTPETVPEWWLK